jgi:hypothetical protein
MKRHLRHNKNEKNHMRLIYNVIKEGLVLQNRSRRTKDNLVGRISGSVNKN